MSDLEQVLAQAVPAALAIFDLDGFKDYNDRFGHPAGDSLLIRLTAGLARAMAAGERAYRLGGDEFCVLAETRPDRVDAAVQRWAECLGERGDGFTISASSGAAVLPSEARDASEALLRLRPPHVRAPSTADAPAPPSRHATCCSPPWPRATRTSASSRGRGRVDIASGSAPSSGCRHRRSRSSATRRSCTTSARSRSPTRSSTKPGPLDEHGVGVHAPPHRHRRAHPGRSPPSLAGVAQIVRATHERVDGQGYPDAIAADQIPLAARIISVCDAYDAMTSQRPLPPARSAMATALAELRALRRDPVRLPGGGGFHSGCSPTRSRSRLLRRRRAPSPGRRDCAAA